jgi:hypothetical protein
VDATTARRGHDGQVTEPASEQAGELPPDPAAYDSPRAERARAKGLKAPYVTGGDDPDLASARAEERRLWRILVAMVLVIVLAGFVIGILVALIPPASGG